MTTKRMLIDASHPEETRVAIVSGLHLEDFDVEVESRRQLRGNIYLAKVTRVEPSLQAAFVDYGGNRHGFLAFSEIHPDYYQIPVADREALVAEQQEAETEAGVEAEAKAEAEAKKDGTDADSDSVQGSGVEVLGGDEADDVQAERPVAPRRRYKIQEVVKRRQILLVQVVKEERGTKGAALTTYLSLAGRYCVLMPNTARGGGISRKISNTADRKRLKKILNDLKIPGVMAVIVRTAGQKRSKAEIKRDYEYLMRLWESVREVTLESMAPCLVHEEGNLIKRSIRDLYDKDIGEIIIDGDNGYRTAKDFMKLLIPSHTKRVQPFKEADKQLFQHFQVENQLDAMHTPDAQLKSGGYIVINPTEALVSIDVNSGRATRGRNIEETALKTNLEASDEIARQLKLRDLAGLIVIDYIDMEISRNQTKVERRLKDAMRSDRARIQIGRISPFGLLELSRQRMRPSLIETSSDPCPYCEGTGIRRSADSAALHLLRAIKEEAMQQRSKEIVVHIPTSVALYILNNQRDVLAEMEANYKISITVETDDALIPPAYRLERDGKPVEPERDAAQAKGGAEEGGKRRRRRGRRRGGEGEDTSETPPKATEAAEPTDDKTEGATVEAGQTGDEEKAPERTKRRRRGRRGGRRRGRKPSERIAAENAGEQAQEDASAVSGDEAQDGKKEDAKTDTPAPDQASAPTEDLPVDGTAADAKAVPDTGSEKPETKDVKKPAKRTRARRPKKTEAKPAETDKDAAKKDPAEKKPARASRRKAKPAPEPAPETRPDTASPENPAEPAPVVSEPPKPTQSEPETVIPVAASAKTQVIAVGGDDDKGDAAKKSRKGWWQ